MTRLWSTPLAVLRPIRGGHYSKVDSYKEVPCRKKIFINSVKCSLYVELQVVPYQIINIMIGVNMRRYGGGGCYETY